MAESIPDLPKQKTINFITLYLCIMILLVGCREIGATEQTPLASSTRTERLSYTSTPSRTSSPIPGIKYSMPVGEYLVSIDVIPDSNGLFVNLFSPDGTLAGMFPLKANSFSTSVFSPHMGYWVDYPFIFDLNTGSKQSFDKNFDCSDMIWAPDNEHLIAYCRQISNLEQLYLLSIQDHSIKTTIDDDITPTGQVSWSPDSKFFIGSYGTDHGESLFVYSLDSQLTTLIPNADGTSESVAYTNPVWSPNGDWIAYTFSVRKSGEPDETEGLHLMNAECLSSPSTCLVTEPSIVPYGLYSWSPDGQYLATAGIKIFQIENRSAVLVKTYSLPDVYYNRIAWSPNGEWLASDTDKGIYVVNVLDGTITRLKNVGSFFYWISVP